MLMLRWTLLALSTLFLTLSGTFSSTRAATIVADGYYIYVLGKIVPGDFAKFSRVLRTSNNDVLYVGLASEGGSVQEAVKIGRLVRALYLTTFAPATDDYAPAARAQFCGTQIVAIDASAPCMCASACFLIWSGGATRSGEDLRLHRIAFDKTFYGNLDPAEAARMYDAAFSDVKLYLREMNIPDAYFEKMASMPSYTTVTLQLPEAIALAQTPAFEEWVTARCGGLSDFSDEGKTKFGECVGREQLNATRSAVSRYRASGE